MTSPAQFKEFLENDLLPVLVKANCIGLNNNFHSQSIDSEIFYHLVQMVVLTAWLAGYKKEGEDKREDE
jgi:hypothetical protein